MPSEPFGLHTERSMLIFSKVVAWVVYAYVIFVDVMLLFRVLLLLSGANMQAGFYQFVLQATSDAMGPFRSLFPPHPVGQTGYLDVSAIFAIVVYLLVAYLVGQLVSFLDHKARSLRRRS